MRASLPIITASLFLVAMLAVLACVSAPVAADEAASSEVPITRIDREHWAFQPLADVEPPDEADPDGWSRNSIDRFVLAALSDAGLAPSPEADRWTLIRRVTLDLTGLPPTPAEVDQFIADQAPGAFERLVDRLLASDAYGERWAQHWLDLARFAETDGFELDLVRLQAWKYRDWVIRALNEDLPYGEFVRMQIAGDLIRPGDEWAAIATGFALAGPDMSDINLESERRHMVLNDISATVGSVFLGLQIGCAECHDHKYDPLSQADFYRLRAFFETALQFGGKPDRDRTLREAGSAAAMRRVAYLYERGDFRRPGPRVEPAFPRIAVMEEATSVAAKSGDRDGDAGGEHHSEENTLPRVALADWLASDENFLSRRVIVNRVWQHHFGRGLVLSPSDFGVMSQPPSHPELLDWLARELGRRGGSLKQLHRLVVTSATYRQASSPPPAENSADQIARWQAASQVDPENRLLWRANRRRLEGEAIRDAMLAVGDRLSPRRGGPGVRPPLPDELRATLLKGHWVESEDAEDHHRRSIYVMARRNLRLPIFDTFDRPEPNASCPVRSESTTAPQALILLNSTFALDSARGLAQLARQRTGDDQRQQIELVYRRALGRPPTAAQMDRAERFLAERSAASAADGGGDETVAERQGGSTDPLVLLCLALLNTNEFVYVD